MQKKLRLLKALGRRTRSRAQPIHLDAGILTASGPGKWGESSRVPLLAPRIWEVVQCVSPQNSRRPKYR